MHYDHRAVIRSILAKDATYHITIGIPQDDTYHIQDDTFLR